MPKDERIMVNERDRKRRNRRRLVGWCATGTSIARPRLAEIFQMLQCDIGDRGDRLLAAEVDQLFHARRNLAIQTYGIEDMQ
jgi:hypothetical protein